MPRRITKAFFATAAAGATITTLGLAASPAGAASMGHNVGFTPTGTLVATNANCPDNELPSDNCGRRRPGQLGHQHLAVHPGGHRAV
jgi:hypothetical protein